MLVQTF